MTRQVVHNHTGRVAFGFSTNGEKWVEKVTLVRQGGEWESEREREDSCLDLPLCRQHLPAEDRDKKAQLTRTHKRLTFPRTRTPPPHGAAASLFLFYFFLWPNLLLHSMRSPLLVPSIYYTIYSGRSSFIFSSMRQKREELSSFLATGFWQSKTALSSSCVFFCYPFVYFQLAFKRFCIIISHFFLFFFDFAISLCTSRSAIAQISERRRKWRSGMVKKEGSEINSEAI